MFTNNRLLVEQLQAFANGGTTDADVAGELVGVERVHRLTEFEHHVVGDVDNRLNAADAGAAQALAHPVRRARFRIDLRDDAHGVARAVLETLDLDLELLMALDHGERKRTRLNSSHSCDSRMTSSA